MESRNDLPVAVNTIVVQLDALMNKKNINPKQFKQANNLKLDGLQVPYKHEEDGVTHTLAGWLHESGNQKALNWLYQRASKDRYEKPLLLNWAVVCRQSDEVLKGLDATTQSKGHNRNNAMHAAVKENNIYMVNFLIRHTDFLNKPNALHNRPLHAAVTNGYLDIAKTLIEAGAGIDSIGMKGDTPLHIALRSKHEDKILMIDLLCVNKNTDISITNNTGDTAIHVAARSDNSIELLRSIYEGRSTEDLPRLINLRNRRGETPFSIAAKNGNVELLQKWIGLKYNNLPTTVNAFKVAAKAGKAAVVILLSPPEILGVTIKQECEDTKGSALYLAAQGKHLEAVKAICLARLKQYRSERDNDEDYKKHTYFFKKRGAGYSRQQKLDAVDALTGVLSGNDDSTLDAHKDALNNGDLKKLKNLVFKYCKEGYTPEPEQQHHGGGGFYHRNDRYNNDFGHYIASSDALDFSTACSQGGCTIL